MNNKDKTKILKDFMKKFSINTTKKDIEAEKIFNKNMWNYVGNKK